MAYSGTLIIRAYTGGGAYPVAGAAVRIEGQGEIGKDVLYVRYTDRNGLVPAVELPAPSPYLSEAPNTAALPYETYTVTVEKEGYYKKTFENVTVFPSIVTLLPADMLPILTEETPSRAGGGEEAPA